MIELTNGVDSSAIQAITRWLDTQAMAAASVGIRPESLNFTREATSVPISAVALPVTVTAVVPTGGTWIIETTDGVQKIFGNTTEQPDIRPGEQLTAWAFSGDMHAFDSEGDRLTTLPDFAPQRATVGQSI